jgi:pantothenate kinase type III
VFRDQFSLNPWIINRIKELTREIREHSFQSEPAVVIDTGGFSRLFEYEKVFDALLPDLVLLGLEHALSLSEGASRPWKALPTEVAP